MTVTESRFSKQRFWSGRNAARFSWLLESYLSGSQEIR
jgi:hypothetical protein